MITATPNDPTIPVALDPRRAAEIFARLVRKHRLARGLTQAQLAERLGMNQRGVSDWEISGELPPVPRLTALRIALGPAFITELERELGLGRRSKSMRERG